MSRRYVRMALEVLESRAIISRVGKVGRAVRYRVGTPELADRSATHVAGQLAEQLAEVRADRPATNRTEGNHARARETARTHKPLCGHCVNGWIEHPDTGQPIARCTCRKDTR
jgi:hypothetical protein